MSFWYWKWLAFATIARPASTVWPGSILLAAHIHFLILISPILIMDCSRSWSNPLKNWGMKGLWVGTRDDSLLVVSNDRTESSWICHFLSSDLILFSQWISIFSEFWFLIWKFWHQNTGILWTRSHHSHCVNVWISVYKLFKCLLKRKIFYNTMKLHYRFMVLFLQKGKRIML